MKTVTAQEAYDKFDAHYSYKGSPVVGIAVKPDGNISLTFPDYSIISVSPNERLGYNDGITSAKPLAAPTEDRPESIAEWVKTSGINGKIAEEFAIAESKLFVQTGELIESNDLTRKALVTNSGADQDVPNGPDLLRHLRKMQEDLKALPPPIRDLTFIGTYPDVAFLERTLKDKALPPNGPITAIIGGIPIKFIPTVYATPGIVGLFVNGKLTAKVLLDDPKKFLAQWEASGRDLAALISRLEEASKG